MSASHQEGAQPAAEALPALQRCDGQHQRLLRHPLDGRRHRQDQHGAARVPEQVCAATPMRRG